MHIVNVVYVETSETVVTGGSDSILRLSAAKCYVTVVEANGKSFGVIKAVVITVKLSGICANAVADISG